MKYLGFDISSTTVGWSYITIKNGIIQNKSIKCGFIKPKKSENEITDLVNFSSELQMFKKINKKDLNIVIEEFPFFISKGRGNFNSTARTITKLAIYTRIAASKLYSIFEIEPIFYKVATIRASMRRLINVKELKKEEIPNAVEKIISNNSKTKWEFPYVLNKNNAIKKESMDIGDSFAVSFTHAYKLGELNIL